MNLSTPYTRKFRFKDFNSIISSFDNWKSNIFFCNLKKNLSKNSKSVHVRKITWAFSKILLFPSHRSKNDFLRKNHNFLEPVLIKDFLHFLYFFLILISLNYLLLILKIASIFPSIFFLTSFKEILMKFKRKVSFYFALFKF